MTGNINLNSLKPAVQQHLDRTLIATPYPNLIHGLAADFRTMPAHAGTEWVGRKYNRYPTFQVPIGNASQDPTPQNISAVDIAAKINVYAMSSFISSQVVIAVQEPVINELTKLMGLAMRETQDVLLRDVLMSSASVVNFVGGNNGRNPSNGAPSDFDRVARILMNNNAWKITRNVKGQDRFGTTTVRNAYIAMASTMVASDLENMVGFKHKDTYADPDKALASEFGSYRDFRYVLSTQGARENQTASISPDTVFDYLFVADQAYGTIDQDLGNTKFWYRNPQIVSAAGLNATIGVSFMSAQCIYQDGFVVRGRCTILAN